LTKLKKYESDSSIKCKLYENFIVTSGLTKKFDSFIESKYAIVDGVGVESKDQLYLFSNKGINDESDP
jgi:hypothetical protein